MKVAEIRSRFLKFFAEHNHTVVASSPLIPAGDQTLLFTNAGMVQFKDVFTGMETRSYRRAVSVQKCVRAGGKHNDLENVGFTARHHTFFEMLGNFSFGDYFKEEAIRLAWTFVTEELKIPKEKLYATVHLNDDEAADLWTRLTPLGKERISRFDKDNFWSMGETGPCGPCSEIFVDRGEKYGCGRADCRVGCECDRYIEIWNLVFMQYNRDETGKMTPLPKPSVDTGAGLERIASVLQEKETKYDTDIFVDILTRTAALLGRSYDTAAKEKFAYRVIADHSRAITFLISDGVIPSNEGRGYVLRRIIRRAVRYGKNIGFNEPFLFKTCGFVIDQMKSAYPETEESRGIIQKMVFSEEEQFLRTLERGLALLDEEMALVRKQGQLGGDVAFKLYDTYGFPLDLTRLILREENLAVDEEGFEACMKHQKEMSRKSWKGDAAGADASTYIAIEARLKKSGRLPQYVGHNVSEAMGTLVAMAVTHGEKMQEIESYTAKPGEETMLIAFFDQTPFYGEGGGQAGDHGSVVGEDFRGTVTDCQKPLADLIAVAIKPEAGSLKVGQKLKQSVNHKERMLTARNHTATHILHWALRDVLGTHVKQAGSMVSPELLRFDFSHFAALTPAELLEVETKVNERIFMPQRVNKQEMAKDEAIASGAIAFFGEKYGDKVRVVKIGDFSTELCGGSHVDDTAQINLFKIVSEASIAAGVRRITALTSQKAFEYLAAKDNEARHLKEKLKATSLEDAESKIDKLNATEKLLRKEIESFKSQALSGEVDSLVARADLLSHGVKLIVHEVPFDEAGVKTLREFADRLKQKLPGGVIVLGMQEPRANKGFLLAAVEKGSQAKVKANEIIAALSPMIEGRGGGKPDMAQAGGNKADGVGPALLKARDLVAKMLV